MNKLDNIALLVSNNLKKIMFTVQDLRASIVASSDVYEQTALQDY